MMKKFFWQSRDKFRHRMSILVCCLSVFVIIFYIITKPIYFENDGKLYNVTFKDSYTIVDFDEKVTNVNINEYSNETYIEASTTILDKLLNKKGSLSYRFSDNSNVFYSNHNNTSDFISGYGIDNGGVVILPRLVLNYIFTISFLMVIVLASVFFVIKNKINLKNKVKIIALPISFILSFITIKGFDGSSYNLTYDMGIIFLLSLCYYLLFNYFYNIRKSAFKKF